MTTHALMELADRHDKAAATMVNLGGLAESDERVKLHRETATQLRTAAAEGGSGEVFGLMKVPDGKDYAPNVDSLLDDLSNIRMGCVSNGEYERVNNHIVRSLSGAPTDSGAGRDGVDAERWRTLMDVMPSEYNGEKGYIRWYLPRERGGFMSLQEHIDRLISIRSAHTAAIVGAAGEQK